MAGDVNAARETVAAACKAWDFLEGAMALEKIPALRNHVSIMCAREEQAANTDSGTPSLSLLEKAMTM